MNGADLAPFSFPTKLYLQSMPIGEQLLKKLQKKYEPSSLVEGRSGKLDIAFKTDHNGDPVLLFIGRKSPNGKVIGQRFVRTLIFDPEGNKIKDHWELKGRAS